MRYPYLDYLHWRGINLGTNVSNHWHCSLCDSRMHDDTKYCHQCFPEGAKIQELEEKLCKLLCHATGGLYSKAERYSIESMYEMVDEYIERRIAEELAGEDL